MTFAPFQAVWADIGEAETGLLMEVFDDAVKLHNYLRERREAGKPAGPYAEHIAMTVESRLRALLAHSPHLLSNFETKESRR